MPPDRPADWMKTPAEEAGGEVLWKDVLVIKDVDPKSRTVKALISTDEVDSDNERIDPASVESCKDDFLRRGFVSYMHGGWAGTVIGQPLELWREGTKIYSVGRIGRDYQVPTPLGMYGVNDIWAQVEQGMLRCTSIGGRGKRLVPEEEHKGEPIVVQMTSLWEWSFVPRGANPSAVVEQVMRAAGLMPKCPECERMTREREEQIMATLSIEQLAKLFDGVRRGLETETLSAEPIAELLQKMHERLRS